MAKGSTSVRRTGGFSPSDSTFSGKIGNVRSLKTIKEPQVYKEVGKAISRYESALGIRQKEIKLADLPSNVNGVHATSADGRSEGIFLNSKVFNKTKKEIEARTRNAYESGWSTVTNKPIAHTVTHELAHATWNNHLKGDKYEKAGVEIKELYKKWSGDGNKKGYGEYARSNVNEFFAETVTKAVHGVSDDYTKAVKGIIKKHNL